MHLGIRDISQVLKISQNTVTRTIKKTPVEITPYLLDKTESGVLRQPPDIHISYAVGLDEFWSFVGPKKRRRWTWYAIERKTGVTVAWKNGSRGNRSLEKLLKKLSVFPIKNYSTDNWHSYSSLLPPGKHRIGKDETWEIERKALNFRAYLKRLQRSDNLPFKEYPNA